MIRVLTRHAESLPGIGNRGGQQSGEGRSWVNFRGFARNPLAEYAFKQATQPVAGVDDVGRSLVAGFYAAWSFAGFFGALLASAAAGTTMSLGLFFLLITVVLVPVQLLVGRWRALRR